MQYSTHHRKKNHLNIFEIFKNFIMDYAVMFGYNFMNHNANKQANT